MAEPYLGEIRMFAGAYAPVGWALCDGSLIRISDNEALYTLLGTTYGGDGQTTFALPDLRGRVPIHKSNTTPIGLIGGTEQVTLTQTQLPLHTHDVIGSSNTGEASSPANAVWAASPLKTYSDGLAPPPLPPINKVPMSGRAIGVAGGNLPHDNMMPSLTITYIIALYGIFPQPN
ncbi:phage tail protein [Paenibacillus sp. 2TAB19]|uniref:phage tail protein n=1 Tax=Paenibacillus sp. 2TAB19 TaxID=3233003 RepID=UPI003F99F1EA